MDDSFFSFEDEYETVEDGDGQSHRDHRSYSLYIWATQQEADAESNDEPHSRMSFGRLLSIIALLCGFRAAKRS